MSHSQEVRQREVDTARPAINYLAYQSVGYPTRPDREVTHEPKLQVEVHPVRGCVDDRVGAEGVVVHLMNPPLPRWVPLRGMKCDLWASSTTASGSEIERVTKPERPSVRGDGRQRAHRTRRACCPVAAILTPEEVLMVVVCVGGIAAGERVASSRCWRCRAAASVGRAHGRPADCRQPELDLVVEAVDAHRVLLTAEN